MSEKGRVQLSTIKFHPNYPGVCYDVSLDIFTLTNNGNSVSRSGYIQVALDAGKHYVASTPDDFCSLKRSVNFHSLEDIVLSIKPNSFDILWGEINKLGYSVESFVPSLVTPILNMQSYQKLLDE